MKRPRKIGKVDELIQLMDASQWEQAIRLAATFPELGEQKDAIKGAHGALTNRRFYEQLGKDVEAMVQEGIVALKTRYAEYPRYKETRDALIAARSQEAKEWAQIDETKKRAVVQSKLNARKTRK